MKNFIMWLLASKPAAPSKRLSAWDLKGLSDAVAHLIDATNQKDESKIETCTIIFKHHARKVL